LIGVISVLTVIINVNIIISLISLKNNRKMLLFGIIKHYLGSLSKSKPILNFYINDINDITSLMFLMRVRIF
jgi:hypothetical protein